MSDLTSCAVTLQLCMVAAESGNWDAGEMNWQRHPLLPSPVGEGCVHQYMIYVVVRNNNFFL